MFQRAPRVHAKSLFVMHLKANWLHNMKLDQSVSINNVGIEYPIMWNKKSSCLCGFPSNQVIPDLPNNISNSNLLVYPQIHKDFLVGKTLFPDFQKDYKNLCKNNELSTNTLFTKRYTEFKVHKTEHKLTKDEESNRNRSTSTLPTDIQLDEIMDYFLNQAPLLFTSNGWSYNKCSYKILFENMMLGTRTESLNAYIMQINIMSKITSLLLSNPQINIVRMTKNLHDGTVQIRWQVHGIPRHLQMLSLFFDERRFVRYIDGFSVFYVESDGLYHRHILMKMTPMRKEGDKSILALFLARLGLEPGFEGYPTKPVCPTFQEQRKSNMKKK